MAITTATGTKVYIGPAVAQAAADTLAELEALTPYVEVKEVESVGEYGDESSIVNFAALGDGRQRKSKGARDAGNLALTVGHDPLDAGQIALIAAEATNDAYAIKIELSDGPAGYENSVHYFRAIVSSKRMNVGNNDSEIFEDVAEPE
jgi:hypothetical protein